MTRLLSLLGLVTLLASPAQAGRDLVRASTQYLEISTALVTAVPLTMTAWVYADTTASPDQTVLSIGSTTLVTFFLLGLENAANNQRVKAATINNSGDYIQGSSATTWSPNQWLHVAGVFASTNQHTAYLNGVAGTTSSTAAVMPTPGALDRTTIGSILMGGRQDYVSGRQAETCLYTAALTTKEIAALATGARCGRVRPTALLGYWPLWGQHSPELNLGTNHTGMTLVNGPTASRHAPVMPFTRR